MYCKYCGRPENKQLSPCLNCKICKQLVHLDCLSEKKTPGNFSGDVFFLYTCAECSQSGKEIFERCKMSWLHCLLLALNDLSTKCMAISNQGYFHWRTHIGQFINRNWNLLFPSNFKRKKNWSGTFSGTLSHFNQIFFQSGSNTLNDSGWWKLAHGFSPALIKYLNSEIVIMKQKRKVNKSIVLDDSERAIEYAIIEKVLTDLGLHYLITKSDKEILTNVNSEHPEKRQKLELPSTSTSVLRNDSEDPGIDDYLSKYFWDGEESLSDFDNFLPDFEESESSNSVLFQNDTNSAPYIGDYSNYPSSGENADTDSVCQSPYLQNHKSTVFSEESNDSRVEMNTHQDVHSQKIHKTSSVNITEAPIPAVPGLFSSEPSKPENTRYPWETSCKINNDPVIPLTEYEEIQLFNGLNDLCQKSQYVDVDKKLIRLRGKLALRKLKRSKHITLFNVDSLVCKLANYPVDEAFIHSKQDFRVLDRFQYVPENLSGATVSSCFNFATRLAGYAEVNAFVSPYSGRLLKPFIRRDTETRPMWLRLMNELQEKVNKHPHWEKPEVAPIDYCYVRPQHIAPINSLCSQFMWPGIDLTEALQYPDFSCVVLYKKLVIGFAFLVPDVRPSEAYISYIFTRPGWRKCGIANFMLYHLIQTCIGKDITLHVSATNPAIFLYQKFGFKIEELIQEFYEKYFPADSTECTHALFLRLCR